MHTQRPIIRRELPGPAVLEELADLDPVRAQLYAARGVTSPGQLDYGLAGLAPVSLLENVDAAVDLLRAKRDRA